MECEQQGGLHVPLPEVTVTVLVGMMTMVVAVQGVLLTAGDHGEGTWWLVVWVVMAAVVEGWGDEVAMTGACEGWLGLQSSRC